MTSPGTDSAQTGAVYDLGYVPYDGERTGRRGAIRSTIRDGMQRVMGIRRRARKKVIPWILVTLAVVPAIVFVGLSFLLSSFAPGTENPYGSHADYFALTASIVMLFSALAAPEELIPDRREGVLAIYSSRPMRADDYVWARASALGLIVLGFLLAPQVLMYVGFAALSPNGFWSGLTESADQIPRIIAAGVVYVLALTPVALLIAAFASRKTVASGVYVAVMWLTIPVSFALSQLTEVPGARYASLLSIYGLPEHVRDWIFDVRPGTTAPAGAGVEPWISLTVIVIVAIASFSAVIWRYRRLM